MAGIFKIFDKITARENNHHENGKNDYQQTLNIPKPQDNLNQNFYTQNSGYTNKQKLKTWMPSQTFWWHPFFILMRRLPQQSMAPYHRRKHVTRVTNFLTAAIMIPETWKLDMRSMVLCSLFFNYRRFPEPDIRGVLSGICGLFLSYGMNGMDFGTSDTAGQTLSPVYLNKH